MKSKANVAGKVMDKRKSCFFLTAHAREIIDEKVGVWGISKSGVVELALRNLSQKDLDNSKHL